MKKELLTIITLSLLTINLNAKPNDLYSKIEFTNSNVSLDLKYNLNKKNYKNKLNIGMNYIYFDDQENIQNHISNYLSTYFEMTEYLNRNLEFALGYKFIYSNNKFYNDDFISSPLYVKFNYILNQTSILRFSRNYKLPPIKLLSQFSYAPIILSYNEAKIYSDIQLGIQIPIVDNIDLSISYKYIKEQFNKDYDIEVSNNLFFGIEIQLQ